MSERFRVATTTFTLGNFYSESELCTEIERNIRFAKDYGATLILFPEYSLAMVNGLIMSSDSFLRWQTIVSELSSRHHIWIIGLGGGVESGPEVRKNSTIIAGPDGLCLIQDKLHLTEYEVHELGLQAGETINLFQVGEVTCSMLVCLDVEFPEPCRQIAQEGGQILFVLSWTDDHYGEHRVRICTQARCIENQIYTVLSTLTGQSSLPGLEQGVGQAAIFGPADIGFPQNGIIAESTGGRQVIVSDIDVGRLNSLRSGGSVLPLTQIRGEPYNLQQLNRPGAVSRE